MSHISRTTSERKSLNSVLSAADGISTTSKSRSASVAAGVAPPSARASVTPGGAVSNGHADAFVVWEQSGLAKDTTEPVLTPCAKHTGFVQCMLSVRWIATDGRIVDEVWSGDGDGRLVIRDTMYGVSNGTSSIQGTIRKYLGVYITCLARAANNVWAGYSDGSVRVFQIDSRTEVMEIARRHGGAITALQYVQAPGDYGRRLPLMLSASEDFRIHAHRVDSLQFVFQLTTPGACVRCMDTDGDYLFTGGEDGMIRCWSLEKRQEARLPGTYPLHAYREGGVRTLSLHHNALFACGGVCASMWDVETAELLAVFKVPEGVKALQATLAPGGFTLWVAGSDGYIYIYDIADLTLIHVADGHSATLVKCMEVVSRAPVIQTIATYPDGFVYISTETGRLDAGYESIMLTRDVQTLLEQLNRSQEEVLRQHTEIRRQSATLRKYRKLQQDFQSASTAAIQASNDRARATRAVCAEAAARQLSWCRWVFSCAAKHLADVAVRDLVHRRLRKWSHTANFVSNQRSQQRLSATLLQNVQESFQGACIRKAIQGQRRRDRNQALRQIAADVLQRTQRIQSLRFLQTWKFYVKRSKIIAKQQDIAVALEKSVQANSFGVLMKHWTTVTTAVKRARLEQATEATIDEASFRISYESDRRKAGQLVVSEAFIEGRSHLATMLGATNSLIFLRNRFAGWLSRTLVRSQKRHDDEVVALNRVVGTLIKELEEIESHGEATEAQLDSEIAEKERQVDSLEAAIRTRELMILQLRDVEQDMMRRLNAAGTPIPGDLQRLPNEPESIQQETTPAYLDVTICDNIMRTMLQRGMNCRSHAEVMQELSKSAAARPGATFMSNLALCRAEVEEAFSPSRGTASITATTRTTPAPRGATAGRASGTRGTSPVRATSPRQVAKSPARTQSPRPVQRTKPDSQTSHTAAAAPEWNVDKALVDKTSRVGLKKSATLLRQAAIAWFYLRSKLNPDTDRIKNLAEIQVNAPLWIQLLERERVLEDVALERDPKMAWGGSSAGGAHTRLVSSSATAQGTRRGSNAGTTTTPRATAQRIATAPRSTQALPASRAGSAAPRAGATRAPPPSTVNNAGGSGAPAAKPSAGVALRATRNPMAVRVVPAPKTASKRPVPAATSTTSRNGATLSPQASPARPPPKPSSSPSRGGQQPASPGSPRRSAAPATPVRAASPRLATSASPGSPPPAGSTTARRTPALRSVSAARGQGTRRQPSPVATENIWE